MVSKETIEETVISFVEYYGSENKRKSDMVIDWLHGQNLTEVQLKIIIKQVLEELTFFPTISQLKTIIYGNEDSEAINGFNIAIQSIRKHGSHTTMTFEDGRIAQTIAIGWNTLQDFGMDETDLVWKQKKWCEMWKMATVKGHATIKGQTKPVYIQCNSNNNKQIRS